MKLRLTFFLLGLALGAGLGSVPAQAQEVPEPPSETQVQIDQTQAQINKLKREIEELQRQLTGTTQQKQTLQTVIKEIDLQVQKLQKNISLTNTQIGQKDREILNLSGDITTTGGQIAQAQQGVAATLRELREVDQESLAAVLLSTETLSSFFDRAVELGSIRSSLQNKIEDLSSLKTDLQDTKSAAERKRQELSALKSRLSSERGSLTATRNAQDDLLEETKNKESNYQELIQQKQAEEAAFESELVRLAAGLAAADTTTAPAPSHGLLHWPLDTIYVTQLFGKTSASGRLYTSGTHNGVDFRTKLEAYPTGIGMPVRAALSGTVQEINLGAVKYCQYGKWVLVKHNNGLTTLYAHLSSVAVSKGERVSTGQTVGYSGDTGYATGPHLHLGLYVSSAVTFKQYTCNSGKTAYIPIAPLNAYLDPMAYLPAL